MMHPTVAALRLALGKALPRAPVLDWLAVLDAAMRERLGALAWHRSGALIRATAPADIVDRWRTHAVVVDQRGRDRLALLAFTAGFLRDARVPTVVLKGMPLSMRLYGDAFVRASDDIDLFVAPNDRVRARAAIVAAGWQPEGGAPPWDELFSRGPRTMMYLEIHETLLSDYLAHLRLPHPATRAIDLAETRVETLDDPVEAAYLAAHLAGHQLPPLLWLVDFHTIWTGFGDDARRRATVAARAAGLHRYLAWAIRAAADAERAADGSRAALARLGVRDDERRDPHVSLWRHARLAPTPLDACRAAGACIWPRPLRGDLRGSIDTTLWRVRRRIRQPAAALSPPRLPPSAGRPPYPPALSTPAMAAAARPAPVPHPPRPPRPARGR